MASTISPRGTRSALVAACAALLSLVCAGPSPAIADEPEASVEERLEDARHALAIRSALLQKLGAGSLGVNVTVEGSRAVLSGQVDDRSVQELAEEVALSVKGIDDVDNRLRRTGDKGVMDSTPNEITQRVGRDAEDEATDALLEVRVKVALVRELGIRGLAIEVEAVDGKVSLRGDVPDRTRRRLARRTAADVKGVEKILDLLEVTDDEDN